jgi:hypothetical protein
MSSKASSTAALLVVALVPALSGCITATANYQPPRAFTVENSKMVAQPFDAVWDQLVRQLSSDFFVINNIDKNSRLINLSFSAATPSNFVNCGHTARTFSNLRGERTYDYNTADSAQYEIKANGTGFGVVRTSRLEGRTNIYVAPEEAGTRISVNTKYVINVNLVATAFDGRPGGSQQLTWDFSTKEPYAGAGPDPVTCTANGSLEKRILNLVGG